MSIFQSIVSSGFGRGMLEKFENTTLFLQLGLPSKLIRHEAFRKDFSNYTGGIKKTPTLRFKAEILKTELFEKDVDKIIPWVPCPGFSETQIQNNRWLSRIQISLAKCGRKTFDAFSERKLCFQIPLTLWGRGCSKYNHLDSLSKNQSFRVHTFLIFLITENFWVSMKLSSMTLIAMLTSSSVTYSRRCILAWASAILIMDSICRTVMGMEPVACRYYKNRIHVTNVQPRC